MNDDEQQLKGRLKTLTEPGASDATASRADAVFPWDQDTCSQHDTGAADDHFEDRPDPFPQRAAEAGRHAVAPAVQMQVGDDRRYTLLARIGSGAMGQVFRAADNRVPREVAVKFLSSCQELPWHLGIEQFKQEVASIGRLNHENIVRVFDAGIWENVPFLVMEHLEGESLAERLSRGPMEPLEATGIMLQVAAGLQHAHSRATIHRDLKPANVFLCRGGPVKILDFGLARFLSPHASESGPFDPGATGTFEPAGLIEGTPAYMAPEQHLGGSQDARVDLWAAGVLFFRMVTGVLPFEEEDSARLRARICRDALIPGLEFYRPNLPHSARLVLERTLARQPERRFNSATDLAAALEALRASLLPVVNVDGWAGPVAGPERRHVTVVSCSLAGLANIAEGMGPESGARLQDGFEVAATEIVLRWGGSVVNDAGNTLLFCFGYPTAWEGGARQAVRAALRLREAMRDLLRTVPLEHASRGGVRIGIHAGTTVVVEKASSAGRGFKLFGDVPSTAQWLTSLAEVDQILISPPVLELVRGYFTTVPRGTRAHQELSRPIDVFEVETYVPGGTRFMQARAVGLTPFVGRRAELERLHGFWQRTLGRRSGELVLLCGEAGIGKSRLAEGLREMVGHAVPVLSGQCWPQTSNSVFFPIVQMLLRRLSISGTDPDSEKLAKLKGLLAESGSPLSETLPWIGALLSIPVPDAGVEPPPLQRRERTLQALVQVIVGLAERAPLLLMLEDAHWMDYSSMELLSRLLPALECVEAMIVVTCRPEFQPPWSGDRVHMLQLERMAPADASILVRRVQGGEGLTEAMISRLVQRGNGIPLFIEELARLAVEMMQEVPGAGERLEAQLSSRIPSSLQDLLFARMNQLSNGRNVARVAAVLGESFPLGLLEAVMAMPAASLKRGLEELIHARIISRESVGGQPGCRFTHALLRDAAYQSLLESNRRALHDGTARVLIERFPLLVSAHPELVAHHLTEAGEGAMAVHYWEVAGRSAAGICANVEAIGHLRRGLGILDRLPEARARQEKALDLETALVSPLMMTKGYISDEVSALYRSIQQGCNELGDSIRALEAMRAFRSYHLARANYAECVRIGHDLAALADRTGEHSCLLEGSELLCRSFFFTGQFVESLEQAHRAMQVADALQDQNASMRYGDDPRVIVSVYQGQILWFLGRISEALETCSIAMSSTMTQNQSNSLVVALALTNVLLLNTGNTYQALDCASRGHALSLRSENRMFEHWFGMMKGWVYFQRGSYGEGLELFSKNYAVWSETGGLVGNSHLQLLSAYMHLGVGDRSRCTRQLEEAEAFMSRSGEHFYLSQYHRLRGELLLRGGDAAQAGRCFEEALHTARRQQARSLELKAATSMAGLWVQQGRRPEARRLLEEALEPFQKQTATSDSRAARHLLALARGRHDRESSSQAESPPLPW